MDNKDSHYKDSYYTLSQTKKYCNYKKIFKWLYVDM